MIDIEKVPVEDQMDNWGRTSFNVNMLGVGLTFVLLCVCIAALGAMCLMSMVSNWF